MTHQEMEIKIKELEKRVKALEQEPCEDAISRQAALDIVSGYEEQLKSYIGLPDDSEVYAYARGLLLSIEKNLNDLQPSVSTEKIWRWIPVSERLPEKNMACLVKVGKFTLTQTAMYSNLMGTLDHRIFYQGDYGHDNFADITQYVKAWMPSPEQYKAESEDKEWEKLSS